MKTITATALIVLLSGCSALGNRTTLLAVDETPGWSQKPVGQGKFEHRSYRKYTHTDGDTTFTLCTTPDTWRMIGIGPPIVPLIPLGLFMDPISNWPSGFFMYIQAESTKDNVTLDLAKVRLRADGKAEALAPVFISRFEFGKDAEWDKDDVCGRPPGHHEAVTAIQEIRGGKAQFVIRFDIPEKDVRGGELDIGLARVGEREVAIPPLHYERDTFWFYAPFVIPHGGPMFGFAVYGGTVFHTDLQEQQRMKDERRAKPGQ
jgi:hypothetical protein